MTPKLPSSVHLFDTGWVEYVKLPPPWEAGRQGILNDLEAQKPQYTFRQPVPVVVRIVWEHDGEEQIETVAWAGPAAAPKFGYPTPVRGSPPFGATPRTSSGARGEDGNTPRGIA